ncbi:pentapeptide repeat-containing protein [Psychrobacter sp. DM8]|uniref:pentapeptide repeat-containing protein n=1 Tax=Psychrobacter sp. DM8 TaxID=3440636 RepID=UPI003F4F8D61
MTKTANFSHKVEIYNIAGEEKCSLISNTIKENKPVLRSLVYENQFLNDLVIDNLMFEFGEFDYTKFNNIRMTSTDLVGVWVTDAIFSECEISDVLVYDCTMYGDIFKNCTFNNVIFKGVSLGGSVFNNCTFDDCKFTSDHINHFTDLSGAIFSNCTLKKTIFDDIDIDKDTKLPL